jgi:hypothetical protein
MLRGVSQGEDSYESAVNELLLRAWSLGNSPEQVAVAEEAARLADTHGDVGLAWEAREVLIEAATFSGFPEKALLAFTWCLGQCDRDPERFDERRLLWQYKWVAADLPYFPQVEKRRILEIHDDMARRYERCGQSLQPIYKVRWLAAMRMGERDLAEEYYRKTQDAPRDVGSDCDACELDDQVAYQLYTEDYERAFATAKPILEGDMTCASVPHVTYASLLLPLLRLGRIEEAVRLHRVGFSLVSDCRKFVDAVANHIEFLTLTRNLEQAARIVSNGLGAAIATTDLDDRFEFFRSSLLLCLSLEGSKDAPSVRLPGNFPLSAPTATELRQWFEREAQDLAKRFDTRNGTTAYADSLADGRSLLETLIRPYPI